MRTRVRTEWNGASDRRQTGPGYFMIGNSDLRYRLLCQRRYGKAR
jgi:hypothetical protein